MQIIRIDPAVAEAGALTALPLASRAPLATKDPTAGTATDSDYIAATKAAFMRETTIGALIDAINNDKPGDDVEGYNPWSYVKTLPPAAKAEAERMAQQYPGIFDNARSNAQVDWTLKRAGEEEAREREMGRSTLGMLTGALLDPLTLVPVFGAAGTATRAARAGSMAAQLAAQTAVSEFLLHNNQLTRTQAETALALGFSTALGGTLGAALPRVLPKAVAEMREPPRLVATTAMGDAESVGGDLSAAAARRDGIDRDLANTGATEKLGGGNAFTRFMASRTPLGRAMNAESPVARTILSRMADIGGYITKGNLAGVGTAVGGSAEDLKLIMQGWADNMFLDGERALGDLQKQLGELGQSKVSNETFHTAAQRILLDVFDEADRVTLRQTFGPAGADAIEATARKWTDGIHELNDRFEKKLIEFGVVRDVAAHQKWIGEVSKADETIKKLSEQKAALKAEKIAPEDPVARADAEVARADKLDEIEQQIARAREDRQFAAARRDEEAGKPEPLGRNYGHAQLWNRQEILARKEEFRDFLLRALVEEPDAAWLAERHNLSWEGLQDLRTTDRARFNEVMREWAGDERLYEINRLEAKLAAANDDVVRLETDIRTMMRDLGDADAALAKDVHAEAAAKAKLLESEVAATEQRLATEKARLRGILGAQDVIEKERQLDEMFPAAPRTTPTEMAGGQRKLQDFLSGEAPAPSEAVRARSTPEAPQAALDRDAALQRKIGRAEERLAAIEREETRLANRRERLDALAAKLNDIQASKLDKKALKGNLTAIIDMAAKDLKVAEKTKGAIKRALVKTDKRPAMYSVVDEIIENLSSGKTVPMMDRVVPETSARMKARRITLDRAQKTEALNSRWLRTDLPNVLALQYDQLAGHLGVREAFNVRKGGTFESIADIQRTINEDYDRLIAANPKRAAQLVNERTRLGKDFDAEYKRLVGATDPGIDRDGIGYWLSRKAREMTYLKYGSGFGLSSLPDIASYALYNRGAMKAIFTAAPEWWRIVRNQSKSDLQGMVAATEIGMRAATTIHRTGGIDELAVRGVGAPGSAVHRVTAGIDKAVDFGVEWTSKLSGLPVWARFLKITAGVYTGIRVKDNVAKYSKLSKAERAELASLGIGESEAGLLDTMFKKHATLDESGRPVFNIEDWESDKARRVFEVAINRNMRRTSITPGVADRPIMMDNAFGSLWLQLQTFAFAFQNRYLVNVGQRVLHTQDYGNVAASVGVLMSTTALVVGLRDIINGKNPAERYAGTTEDPQKAFKLTRELVDRAGLMTFMAPYVSSVMKATNLDNSASRFQRMSPLEPLLGVQASNYGDINRLVSALGDGDGKKSLEAAARIAPFALVIRGIVNNFPD